MPPTVLDCIIELLDHNSVDYELMHHEAVYTSEAAAQVRGTDLASGAKAIICKADLDFLMFVMPADLRLDSKRVRREFRIRKLRFASPDEVLDLTNLKPGSIPPFGSLFSLGTFCDEKLSLQTAINFNAGDHCVSISLGFADYLKVENPRMGVFAG